MAGERVGGGWGGVEVRELIGKGNEESCEETKRRWEEGGRKVVGRS